MNKYEKYLDMIEYLNAVLSCSPHAINEYNRKKDRRDKIYFYTKFRYTINMVISKKTNDKNNEKIKLILILLEQLNSIKKLKEGSDKKTYSDSDIEFLKQFNGFDLTLDEACLVGKKDEYYNALRLVCNNGKLSHNEELQEYIDSINGDYTPRLIQQFYEENKGNKK